ncbi:MAG: flotillin [Candidatus Omnitrophica bacterium]|nr:flotillin [Candidatus Omnitrophota bacterium]
MGGPLGWFIPIAVVAVVLFIVIAIFLSRYLLICHPNEVIILSGRKRKLSDGKVVGYRIIQGGKAFRIPIIEKAARMSLETIPLELSVKNAYSKGGIPLKVDAIANVKIQSDESSLGNAVERFLSLPESELHKIAKDTLEGNLRGVLATLTPEEVNEDRLKFAQSLIGEADNDLQQLGLQLDTLKIQNVSDEAGYLDSIGRRKTAEVLAEARKGEAEQAADAQEAEAVARQRAQVAKAKADQAIRTAEIEAELEVKRSQASADSSARQAEAEQAALAQEAEAEAKRRADTAKAVSDQKIKTAEIDADREVKTSRAQADQNIAMAQNDLRIKEAELEKDAVIKEQEASVAGEKAKAQYEQAMEEERIILQQKRLMADVIEPARAKREAMEEEAKGAAAPILQEGQARLKVLEQMISTYKTADGDGEKIFMLNMLPEIIGELVKTIDKVNIDKMTVIDGGQNGSTGGVSRVVNQLPGAVISLAEQIETATGVNILSRFKTDPTPAPRPTEPPTATGVPSVETSPPSASPQEGPKK